MTTTGFKRGLIYVAVLVIFSSYAFGVPLWASVPAFSIVALWRLGGFKFLKLVVKTAPRDIRLIRTILSITSAVRRHASNNVTVPDLFEQTAHRHPDKLAFIFEDERWTFGQLDEYANRVANFFLAQGMKRGDVVALFMENCPEYVGVWLGLGKIGVVSAFINYNLRQQSLVHSIKVSDASAVIFSSALGRALDDIISKLDEKNTSRGCYAVKGESHLPQARNMQDVLLGSVSSPPPPLNNKSFEDKLCFIYTSGTTGLPKAVVIKHRRFFSTSWGQGLCFGVRSHDTLYCTLPLYHSAAGMLIVGTMINMGCTIVLRKKFSASNFWADCHKHRCTVIYYVGEICRYLLAHPPASDDTGHCVRLAIGNSLRPSIWREFKTRFSIARIGEFYGATEGITNLANLEGKEGAVGAFPILLQLLSTVAFLKVVPETNEYVRDSNGFCVKAAHDEPAEIVAKIDDSDPLRKFDGYNDLQASEKKVLRNVFVHGDAYFLSGDILRMDEEGYLYFCDRTGDTFRWKGENVSTTEVESVVMRILEHRDACVYGVEVPGAEGKAGMAAIAVGDMATLDVSTLAQKLFVDLPSYAVPVFIRLSPSVDMTGTYKMQKNRFRSEGYDTRKVSDPLYILELRERKYVPLDGDHFEQVMGGTYRL